MVTLDAIIQLEHAGRRLGDRLFRTRASGAVTASFPRLTTELAADGEVQLVAALCEIPASTAADWIGAVAWARWAELCAAARAE